MSSAKVTFQEIDLSTRVPSFPGVFGGMVIQAKKGPVNEPFLVTTDTQLLEVFTPDNLIFVVLCSNSSNSLNFREIFLLFKDRAIQIPGERLILYGFTWFVAWGINWLIITIHSRVW